MYAFVRNGIVEGIENVTLSALFNNYHKDFIDLFFVEVPDGVTINVGDKYINGKFQHDASNESKESPNQLRADMDFLLMLSGEV